jgi:hypothetical protein
LILLRTLLAKESPAMSVDAAINEAILGKDVEQKVTDCLQDWSAAASDAVKQLMEKQRQEQDAEVARAQFILSLIGNLAWAATVFFPPAAAVAVTKDFMTPVGYLAVRTMESPGPSAATKIVSVLGATVGSNTVGRLLGPTESIDWSAIDDHLNELVPKISESLAQTATEWKKSYLAERLFAVFNEKNSRSYNMLDLREAAQKFRQWCDSYEGGRELRRAVWEKFVFPVDGLSFERGKHGLKNFLFEKLATLKTKYDNSYKAFQIQCSQQYMAYMLNDGNMSNPFAKLTFEEWKWRRGPTFHFVARVEGLPEEFLKAQEIRLRNMELRRATGNVDDERIPVPGAGLPAKR